MSETEEQRIERLRAQNVEALRMAGHLLIANEDIAVQIMCELMGAPSKAQAKSAVNMVVLLIAHLARQMSVTDDVHEVKFNLDS